MECGVSAWDLTFVRIEQEEFFNLLLAANYLDIESFLLLTCAKVAVGINGRTVEDMRTQYNLVNDFTPEEEANWREEKNWCEGP